VTNLKNPSTALSPYKILDLTTCESWLCGRLLADMGATVIKVEPPEGDPGRHQGPFYHHTEDPELSLRWWFLNRGKQSITLDLNQDADQIRLRHLTQCADAVLESYPVGYLLERSLDYKVMSIVQPKIVMTSITAFGQSGPYAHFQANDLTLSALSGAMYLSGDVDRAPVRISIPQYEMHGATEAAVNTAMALYHARRTGNGQHIDVSSQLASIRTLMNATQFPPLEGRNLKRTGVWLEVGPMRWRSVYAAKNGHVAVMLAAGALASSTFEGLMNWARKEVEVPESIDQVDWKTIDLPMLMFDPSKATLLEELSHVLEPFFRLHTKEALYAYALEKRVLLAPVSTIGDIRKDEQLKDRAYFETVTHEGLGTVDYPSQWAKLSLTPLTSGVRAPHIGEHNQSVWEALGSHNDQVSDPSQGAIG
jgi:crotonobetainyl-CoA:carnitine CoA-transferase CaiB-like acyl-CoA transferase